MKAALCASVGAVVGDSVGAVNCTSFAHNSCLNGQSHSIKKVASTSSADCCKLCSQEAKCEDWTYWLKDGTGMCNLLKSGAERVSGNCSSSSPREPPRPTPPAGAKNVLYFIVDDLRTQLGAYGHNVTATPNLDHLASQSLIFTNAYCQLGVCAPSRGSFMSGRNPDSIGVWNFKDTFRSAPDGQNWIPFPQHFKRHGYTVLGGGKTYHPNKPKNWDEPYSWTQEMPYFPFSEPGCPGNMTAANMGVQRPGVAPAYAHAWCALDLPLDEFYDHKLANHTIAAMQLASSLQRPWFIAAGWRRPHLPWRMPLSFWKQYENVDIRPPTHPQASVGMPEVAFTCGDQCYFELGNMDASITHYNGTTFSYTLEQPLAAEIQVLLRRAYYASVSFLDFEVGRVIAAMHALPNDAAANTVVVFHADHGWSLGENNLWHKFTNFEHTARVPLLIHVPGAKAMGQRTDSLTELVDVYPTVAALAGTPIPTFANGTRLPLDGTDLTPVLQSFEAQSQKGKGKGTGPLRLKNASFSQFPRCDGGNVSIIAFNYCKSTARDQIDFMGYSVRDQRFRFTLWLRWNGSALRGQWESPPVGVELYDHEGDDGSDFDKYAHENSIHDPRFSADVLRLQGSLRAHFDVKRNV